MDWNKYKSYTDSWYKNTIINFCDTINKAHDIMGYTGDGSEYEPYHKDNIVADVTDSYKELSSERIKK